MMHWITAGLLGFVFGAVGSFIGEITGLGITIFILFMIVLIGITVVDWLLDSSGKEKTK